MQYTEREQLTILGLKDDEERISMERLKAVLSGSPSNMIYCEKEGKLVGIVSTGDISRAWGAGQDSVAINRKFTWLCRGEYWKARDILKARAHINAIPVVTAGHVLIGEYTRWDDLLALDYRRGTGRWEGIQGLLLVRPGRAFTDRWKRFEKFKEYLRSQYVEVRCIEHSEVFRHLEVISASRVRRCLERNEWDKLGVLLPETTQRILGNR